MLPEGRIALVAAGREHCRTETGYSRPLRACQYHRYGMPSPDQLAASGLPETGAVVPFQIRA
jgi:hypothetical protein